MIERKWRTDKDESKLVLASFRILVSINANRLVVYYHNYPYSYPLFRLWFEEEVEK